MNKPNRTELEQNEVQVLNKGRFANATLRLCRVGGVNWVMKDYRPKRWLIRQVMARPNLRHELKALQLLQGLPGTPQDAYRVDALAIAYRHMPGRTIARCLPGEYAPDYFPRLEQLVHDMHARGIAHLDLRYMHNVLVCDDTSPAIIDFQTYINFSRLPEWLARRLRNIDISGVYKHWLKRSPETLSEERLTRYEELKRWRKFWILSSYFGRRGRARRRKARLRKKAAQHENHSQPV